MANEIPITSDLDLGGNELLNAKVGGVPSAGDDIVNKDYVESVTDPLDTRVTDVENDVTQNTTDISNINTNIPIIEADVDNLETQVNTIQTDLTNLETSVNNLLGSTPTLQSQIDDNDTDISTIQTDLNNLNAIVTGISNVIGDVANLQTQITSNDNDILNLDGLITQLDTLVGALDIRVTQNETDIANLAPTDLTALQTQVLANQSNITSNDGDILSLQQSLNNLLTTLNGIQLDQQGQDDRITQNETDIANLGGVDVTSLLTRIDQAEADILSNDADILDLQNNGGGGGGNTSGLQTQITSNDLDIAGLQTTLTTLSGIVATNTNNILQNEQDIDDIQGGNTASPSSRVFLELSVSQTTSTRNTYSIVDASQGSIIYTINPIDMVVGDSHIVMITVDAEHAKKGVNKVLLQTVGSGIYTPSPSGFVLSSGIELCRSGETVELVWSGSGFYALHRNFLSGLILTIDDC